ncbi:hypothetical protein ABEF93_008460 [Exophiala dermatitidis]
MAGGRHLLELPGEIRSRIWTFVFGFEDQRFVPASKDQASVHPEYCLACQSMTHESTALPAWNETCRPLLTCRQMFQEGWQALAAAATTCTMYVGWTPDLNIGRSQKVAFSHEIERIEYWLHFQPETAQLEAITAMDRIGAGFPNLEDLVVHAHMQRPEEYSGIMQLLPLAAALVRFRKDCPHVAGTVNIGYMESVPPDTVEGYAGLLKQLVDDRLFVEAVMAQDESGQAERIVALSFGDWGQIEKIPQRSFRF